MSDQHATATAIIRLMQGVVYREIDEETWTALDRYASAVRDHFSVIGVDVVVDENEGYAFLRSRPESDDDALPRLVRRRSLSYNVSLLLVLLRKRLVEFEAASSEGRLVLTTEQIIDLLRVFQGESTNEARIVEQAGRTIAKASEFGFLKAIRGQADQWEVRRVLKAYVDAQTMSDFESKLRDYARSGAVDD